MLSGYRDTYIYTQWMLNMLYKQTKEDLLLMTTT